MKGEKQGQKEREPSKGEVTKPGLGPGSVRGILQRKPAAEIDVPLSQGGRILFPHIKRASAKGAAAGRGLCSFPDGAAPGSRGQSARGAGGGAGTRVSGGMGVRAWIRGSRGPTLPVAVRPVHCPNPPSPSASLHLWFCGYQGNTKVTLRRRHGTHRLQRGTSPSSTSSSELSAQLEFQLIWGLSALLTQPSVLMVLRPWRVNSYQAMAALF